MDDVQTGILIQRFSGLEPWTQLGFLCFCALQGSSPPRALVIRFVLLTSITLLCPNLSGIGCDNGTASSDPHCYLKLSKDKTMRPSHHGASHLFGGLRWLSMMHYSVALLHHSYLFSCCLLYILAPPAGATKSDCITHLAFWWGITLS